MTQRYAFVSVYPPQKQVPGHRKGIGEDSEDPGPYPGSHTK